MRKKIALTALTIGLIALAGCASAPAPPPAPESSDTPPRATDSWTSPEPGHPALALYDDGTLGGFDGCNAFGGSYVRAGDTIELELGYGTLKACVGIDLWLRDAHTAQKDGDTLHVFGVDGTELGILTADE